MGGKTVDIKLVPAHTEIRILKEIDHYETHKHRTESAEFREGKKEFHADHAKCWVDNGYCEGEIEIHHNHIEYSASTEVDWAKIAADYPGFTDVDKKQQMMPLCKKHHTGKYTGKHNISDPIWKLQKYMLPEPLARFEAAVTRQIMIDDLVDKHGMKPDEAAKIVDQKLKGE